MDRDRQDDQKEDHVDMPWKDWDNPKNPLTEGPKGLFSQRQFSNDRINKQLKAGKDPRKVFAKELKKLSPSDRAKVEKRIKDCEHKARQQKNEGRYGGWL
jgi:hypothetical protein